MESISFSDFVILCKGMKSLYTRDNFLPDGDSIKTWYALLKDIPYDVLNTAILKYAVINPFPPTVAELRTLAAEICNGPEKDWGEAWKEATDAIRKYGYYNPAQALGSLNSLTRTCVERIGWESLCKSENPAADRANFRMIYETEIARKKENDKMPEKLKADIAKLACNDADRLAKLEEKK